jgi:hypothetical protein
LIADYVARWGGPDIATDPSVFFPLGDPGFWAWTSFTRRAGAGVWAGGYLQIATPELSDVNDELSAWTFALGEDDPTRQVLARNGYGDVVVVTNEDGMARARVLSPRHGLVMDPDVRPDLRAVLDFYFFGSTERIPGRPKVHPFMDRALYDAWVADHGPLETNEALLPILPFNLGGANEPDNFHVEDLALFYKETGEIWAKAFAR